MVCRPGSIVRRWAVVLKYSNEARAFPYSSTSTQSLLAGQRLCLHLKSAFSAMYGYQSGRGKWKDCLIHTCVRTNIHTYTPASRNTYIHAYIHKHTRIEADRQTGRQTYRQTDIRTYMHTRVCYPYCSFNGEVGNARKGRSASCTCCVALHSRGTPGRNN